jgi:hypothetical protein
MRLSIHDTVNKPDRADYYKLGSGWLNVEVEWADAFDLITVDGLATSAWLNGHTRSEANFISRELIMIDIDSGMTVVDLLADDFYNNYGAGFYATPGYTDFEPRFRIMFRVEEPITDAAIYRKITRGLLEVYSAGDIACKDAARLFFGTQNCVIKEKTEKFLPQDIINLLVQLDDARQAEQVKLPKTFTPNPLTDLEKIKILRLLCQVPIVEHGKTPAYNIWRDIGWGLKHGGYSFEDFAQVTSSAKADRSQQEAKILWDAGRADGKVTMGTVIFYLQRLYGKDCLIGK